MTRKRFLFDEERARLISALDQFERAQLAQQMNIACALHGECP
jgi:hypothetical protein